MNTKQLIVSAALAASLALGIGVALAQDDSTPNAPAEQHGFRGPRGDRGFFQNRPFRDQMQGRLPDLRSLELAEEYTGLTLAEMRDALQNGQTLADLITANGQSVDAFIAAVMENVNARIDTAVENGPITAERAEELKATAQERITAWVNGEPGPLAALLEEYTGLELPELREAHQNGHTLADLITANGQSVDDFIAAVMEPVSARIDMAVENGRITAERAEELKALALERITARVNGKVGRAETSISTMLAEL